ncbi:MAG: hypothetical protein WBJ10_06095, partial [Daejeonella sp.]
MFSARRSLSLRFGFEIRWSPTKPGQRKIGFYRHPDRKRTEEIPKPDRRLSEEIAKKHRKKSSKTSKTDRNCSGAIANLYRRRVRELPKTWRRITENILIRRTNFTD